MIKPIVPKSCWCFKEMPIMRYYGINPPRRNSFDRKHRTLLKQSVLFQVMFGSFCFHFLVGSLHCTILREIASGWHEHPCLCPAFHISSLAFKSAPWMDKNVFDFLSLIENNSPPFSYKEFLFWKNPIPIAFCRILSTWARQGGWWERGRQEKCRWLPWWRRLPRARWQVLAYRPGT